MCFNFNTTIITWYKKLFCETELDDSCVNKDSDINFHYKLYDESENPLQPPILLQNTESETFNTEAYWKTFNDTYLNSSI